LDLVAQAVARAPKVLLLDRSTSALALGETNSVMTMVHDLVRARGVIAAAMLYDQALLAGFTKRVILLADGPRPRLQARNDQPADHPGSADNDDLRATPHLFGSLRRAFREVTNERVGEVRSAERDFAVHLAGRVEPRVVVLLLVSQCLQLPAVAPGASVR
jgi:energy-coupling factor transporter ATP-binding protein EcfA2